MLLNVNTCESYRYIFIWYYFQTLLCSGKDSVILQFLSQHIYIIEIIFYFFTCFLNVLDPNVSFKQIVNIYFSTL